MTNERREINLNELEEIIERDGPEVAMSKVQVRGIAVIKDKDGNVKSEMEITSLELQDEDREECN